MKPGKTRSHCFANKFASLIFLAVFGASAFFGICPAVQARTSLVVLPARDNSVIRLSKGLATLVQENRVLTLSKGVNPVDFSWQEVSIDPASIILTPLAGPDEARLLSVSYPPGENALVWEVYSNEDRELPVVISYLLMGIDHLVTHEILTDPHETRMSLNSSMVMRNFSGENFTSAQIYLDSATQFTTLSGNLETRKILFSKDARIPVVKKYLWDSRTMVHVPDPDTPAPGIPMGYEIENAADAGLGKRLIEQGKVRVFQEDGQGSTIFLGENQLPELQVGQKEMLILGTSRDIQVTLRRMKTQTINVRKNEKGTVQAYDEKIEEQLLVENFKSGPADLILTHTIQGEWEPDDMGHPYTLKRHDTLEFTVALGAGEKKTIPLSYRRLNLFTGKFSRYNRF